MELNEQMQNYENHDKATRTIALMDAYDSYIERSEYKDALRVAQELVEIRGSAQDWSALGFCQNILGSYKEALVSFSQAIYIDPDDIVDWTNLGGLLCKLERYDEALIILDRALELEPDNIETLFNKSIVLNNCGRHDEALSFLNIVVQIQPNFQIAWRNRGLAFGSLRRYEEALESFEKALLLDSNDQAALRYQGIVLANLSRYEQALTSYNRAIELNSRDLEAWLGQGIALSNLDRYDEALTAFDLVIELAPDNAKAWFGRSILLCELEKYEEALSVCDRSLKLGNQDAAVFLNRAKILLALNQWDEGIVVLDDALNRYACIGHLNNRDTKTIICNLLCRTHNLEVSTWQLCTKTLLEVYEKYRFTSLLEQELVQSIRELLLPYFNVEIARTWRDIWQNLVGERLEFQAFLRLLNTAVYYRETKGDPSILLELSVEEQSLFQSFLGIENLSHQFNEADLMWQAGYVALTNRELFGRGVVWFEGDNPRFISRRDDMPIELLNLVDEYDLDQEFLVIAPNHRIVYLMSFDQIGLDPKVGIEPNSEEEYERELDSILAQLQEKGLDSAQASSLRNMTLAYRNGEFSLSAYSQEDMEIVQIITEEWSAGNIQVVADLCRRYLP